MSIPTQPQFKRVFQSQVGEKGTCLAACCASILGLEEAEVGDLYRDETPDHHPDLMECAYRLYEETGYAFAWSIVPPAGLSIGIGPSIRNPGFSHAVVCWDGMIVHDPSPRGADLLRERIRYWCVLFSGAGSPGQDMLARYLGVER